jgi:hypothetical protein
MERETETAQIKHDLEILRARYAAYQRLGRILKSIFTAAGLILAIGALASAVKLLMFDALYGMFYLAALLIFVPALVWMVRLTGLRWIDLAAPRMRGIYHPDFFDPDRPPRPSRSEAESTQQQIAAYEARLSELDES